MRRIYILIVTIVLSLTANSCQQQREKEFISLAYVALYQMHFNTIEPEDVAPYLDQYNWNGITDIALIRGVYYAGQDGSVVTHWNEESWVDPVVGVNYFGKPYDEAKKRNDLCSREVIGATVDYFRKRGLKIWLAQSAESWMTGGSLGVVCSDSELTKKYAQNLYNLAKEYNCEGVDLDWEFPPTEREAEGYRELMRELKALGTKVSVCAINPSQGKSYADTEMAPVKGDPGRYMKWDEIIEEGLVDHINVMQYLGYNPQTKQMDVEIKREKMAAWESTFPQEFTPEKRVKMLAGVGFYSYLIPTEENQGKREFLTLPKIYEKYGQEALDQGVVGGKHAIWTTSDIREIVRHAKAQGWSGVFTWLVTHDTTVDMPMKYNRQEALSEEVHAIWAEE
ncbi:MAG: glycoside hydrolase family 18 protein [Rikenellaceae bacterium]